MTRATELHRRGQLALRRATLRDLLAIWRGFDLAAIERTWPGVEANLRTLIRQRSRDSASLAAVYYRAVRAEVGVAGAGPDALLRTPADAQIASSLAVTGRYRSERLVERRHPRAREVALSNVAGTTGRLTLAGGRLTLLAMSGADRRAQGLRRITGGNPCSFCAGFVGQLTTKDFKAHDHCSCTAEPVFEGPRTAPSPNPVASLEAEIARLAGR